MPYLLLCIGCFFLGFGVIGFILSNTSNLDLLSVQALFEHRSLMLNHVTILLSLIGGMPFLLFLTTFLCMYQTWIKNYKNVIFITLLTLAFFLFSTNILIANSLLAKSSCTKRRWAFQTRN